MVKCQDIATGLKIYNYLGNHHGVKDHQIAKALKMKVDTVATALARLEHYGIVHSFLSKDSMRTRLWYSNEWYNIIDWDVALKMWEKQDFDTRLDEILKDWHDILVRLG